MPSTTSGVKSFPKIKAIKTFLIQGVGSGGDYHNVKGGHWLIDSKIATPMSHYPQYQKSRTDFGINVLGSFCVEIEATDGSKGFATGFGGPPACWLTEEHFKRFLIGSGVYQDMQNMEETWLTIHTRSQRHQQPVRTDVQSFHVLWPQGSASRSHLRD